MFGTLPQAAGEHERILNALARSLTDVKRLGLTQLDVDSGRNHAWFVLNCVSPNVIGCAASPSSVTRPSPQRGTGGRSRISKRLIASVGGARRIAAVGSG